MPGPWPRTLGGDGGGDWQRHETGDGVTVARFVV